jgi:hypothetical protein
MQEKYDYFMANNTCILVPLPIGRKLVSCKWVFKIKQGTNGDVECYKARLVMRGFTQTYIMDYNETFSPVAKFTFIRCILAFTTFEDMEIHQMCHNLSLGLASKARGCKVVGQEGDQESLHMLPGAQRV